MGEPIHGGLMNDPLRQARIDLAAAYRMAVIDGLNEGICNHFTLLVPGRSDQFLLIPYGLHWSEVTASRLMIVDLDGNRVAGEGLVEPTASYIHARLHRAHPHASCVLHTHMPYATALTMIEGGRLEPASQNALRFWGEIAYDEEYNGLAYDDAEGDRLAAVLGDKRILFLAHHGVIVTGASVADAYCDLYYLERACMTQVLAMSTGRPLKSVSAAVAGKTAQQMSRERATNMGSQFEALKRLLDRDQPDYKI